MQTVYTRASIDGGRAGCTFVMGAGKGKTFIAAGLIWRLGMTALYIAPNKHLRGQATEDMKQMFPAAKVYQVKGKEVALALLNDNNTKIFDFRAADICVCVINTAIKLDDRFYSHFGFTIFDEVHMYCSSEFSHIFHLGQTAAILGLSATPNRADGFDLLFRKYVGDVIDANDLDVEEVPIPWRGNVTAIYYHGPPEYTQVVSRTIRGESRVYVQGMIKQFIEDEERNKLCADKIVELHNMGDKNIFAFSESRDHLLLIADILSAKIHEKTGILRGGISRDQIAIAVGSRIILTTYSYSGTGVSIKKMNSIIFLTPRRSNMIQILGRILRLGGNPEITREIIDIVDANTPLRSQFSCKIRGGGEKLTRMRAYEYYNFPVKIQHIYAGKGEPPKDTWIQDDDPAYSTENVGGVEDADEIILD